ncbi:D-cysteine desulfhydrase family protein [Paraglaciecola sp.]|uniref:D-cysteine desulfhydrase family protein n=1 Tax=Paraglaciecola sp. TaxID=1920173 RepID=UPI00273EAB22|nr:D-cysteine desulfhydrase family protein [Paraglaciecola sp.]MDP5032987.1 D-cysteine desulfhydrase family protein [Paraglaciecola sp.]
MQRFNRQALGFFPTPFHALPNFSAALGAVDIYIKRDDLTGLAMGGNKTRKLEYLLAEAVSQGCDCIITAGAIQSNHCRQTAAAAALLSLPCHLLLGGHKPSKVNGNLLLDYLLGSTIHWQGENRKGEGIPDLVARLKQQGLTPYVVPYGGSNKVGALGYVNAMQELQQQLANTSISHIVFASSSGATHAGMMVGKSLVQQDYQIVGINIDKDENANKPFKQVIVDIANETAQQLDLTERFDLHDLDLRDDYIGQGYGVVGSAEQEAISLLAQSEGILLDPVYTGRAMAGLIHLVRSGQIPASAKVLFWHTGGNPALFAYADALT